MTSIPILHLLCFFLLGSSAWILVNAIYAEIPLIVASLNYDYSVISKLTLCITLTSIAPILWSLLVDSVTGMDTKNITKVGIGGVLLLGTGTSLSLSLTDASLQQTSLLITSVASGLVGSMSRVLYFPHAATTTTTTATTAAVRIRHDEEAATESHEQHPQQDKQADAAVRQTTAMASGMAVASLFVAVLAIFQQMDSGSGEGNEEEATPGNEHLFSIQAYFGVVTGIFGLAIAGFVGTLMPKATVADEHQFSMGHHNDEDHDDRIRGDELCADDSNNSSSSNHYGSIEISDKLLRKRSTSVSTKSPMKPNMALLQVESDPHPSSMTTPTFASSLEIQDEEEPHDEDDPHHRGHDSHHHHHDPFAFWKSFVAVSRRHATINAGQFLLNTLTFFLPGIVPYSVQHYDDSQRALHYLTVTQLIAQTLGTMLSGWRQYRSVWLQLLCFTMLWIPTVVLSFVNNTDFQHANQLHSAVPITLNALLNLAYGYSSTTFYHLVNADATASAANTSRETGEESDSEDDDDSEEHHGHNASNDDPHIASRVLGSWNQFGAMCGSLVAYFLVQHGAIS